MDEQMNNEVMATVEEMLDELYDMLEKAWSLPLSGGRTVIDAGRVPPGA